MRILARLWLTLNCLTILTVPARAEKKALPVLRDFPIEVTERLGRAIFEHDQLAWVATDVLFAKIGEERAKSEKVSGWIVDDSGRVRVVRFVRQQGDHFEAAYDLSFKDRGQPELTAPENRTLTDLQRYQFAARQTAIAAVFDGKHPWCGGSPNSVVLPDPQSKSWLVYILRPKPSATSVPIGGHYRVTVSPQGDRVEEVEQLFASCLTLDSDRMPSDSKIVGLAMSHVVSPRPLETHVFLSLQEHTPFLISTSNGTVWKVEDGHLEETKMDISGAKRAQAH